MPSAYGLYFGCSKPGIMSEWGYMPVLTIKLRRRDTGVMDKFPDPPQFPFIRDLMAGESEEEIVAAEARFMRYVELVEKIAEEAGPLTEADFDRCRCQLYDDLAGKE